MQARTSFDMERIVPEERESSEERDQQCTQEKGRKAQKRRRDKEETETQTSISINVPKGRAPASKMRTFVSRYLERRRKGETQSDDGLPLCVFVVPNHCGDCALVFADTDWQRDWVENFHCNVSTTE